MSGWRTYTFPVRRRAALVTMLSASLAVLAACGASSPVAVERSRELADQPTTDPTSDSTDPTTDPTGPTSDPTDPTDPTGPSTDPTTGPTGPSTEPRPPSDILDVGNAKPERSYDDLVAATVADLEQLWSTTYPELYGEPYEPLEGGVFPAYPERTDPVPGCGNDESSYPDVRAYVAFYCSAGDFIAYDDGDDSLLLQLSEELGDSVMGVVLAHEWGHAIQQRNGTFAQDPATIYTEQQADCFSGAWTARARNGEVDGVEFSDADVLGGLAALIAVRDPINVSSQNPGAHGSGFDRVGAFQVGYLNGFARCVELIDTPLPLVPNELSPTGNPDGNAEWGDGPRGILTIVVGDLNRYWQLVFADQEGGFPELTIVAADDPTNVDCAEVESVDDGAAFCPSTNQVFYDAEYLRQLYDQFGDFTVGYTLGTAWSEAAQTLLGSPLSDEPRSLLNDCLTGSWVNTILPENGQPPAGTLASIEPGDLDEAIQTVLLIGDEDAEENQNGTAFEKIDSFRDGVLNTLNTCTDRIPD